MSGCEPTNTQKIINVFGLRSVAGAVLGFDVALMHFVFSSCLRLLHMG